MDQPASKVESAVESLRDVLDPGRQLFARRTDLSLAAAACPGRCPLCHPGTDWEGAGQRDKLGAASGAWLWVDSGYHRVGLAG